MISYPIGLKVKKLYNDTECLFVITMNQGMFIDYQLINEKNHYYYYSEHKDIILFGNISKLLYGE